MEADAGGPVVLDPFRVNERPFGGIVPLDIIGSTQIGAPPLSGVLGTTPTSLTSVSTGVTLGTGGPNIRIGGQEVVGRQDIFGENITLVRDPITGEPTPLGTNVIDVSVNPTTTSNQGLTSDALSDRIQSAIANRESVLGRPLTNQERIDLVNVVVDANLGPGRNLDLSPQTGGSGPGQLGLGSVIPLPVSPGVAAGLTIAGAILGGGLGGGGATTAPSTGTQTTETTTDTTGTTPDTSTTGGGGGAGAGSATGTNTGGTTGTSSTTSRPPNSIEQANQNAADRDLLIGILGGPSAAANQGVPAVDMPPNQNPGPGMEWQKNPNTGQWIIVPIGTKIQTGTPSGGATGTGNGGDGTPSGGGGTVVIGTGTPSTGTGTAGAGGAGTGGTVGGGGAGGGAGGAGGGGGGGDTRGGGGGGPLIVGTGSTGSGGQSGGNISLTFPVATPITVRDPGLNREILREGRISTPAMREIAGSTLSSYGMLGGQPGMADIQSFQNLLGQVGAYNPELTRIASEQTIAANRAQREANIADVQRLSQAAMEAQRAANPELYSTLGTYLPAATGMLATDLERLQGAGRLSAEDIRMAQQSAREASLARGREMDMSGMAAEVLNRDALARQRQNEARANVQQSMQNVYGGIGAAQAATFNPFAALLGQQYGMQTSNVGLNQALFGQGTGFSSGALSNQFVQGLLNPYSSYAADVYGSNFNAANARAIAEANANAAAQGANLQLIGGLAGTTLNYAIPEFMKIFQPKT